MLASLTRFALYMSFLVLESAAWKVLLMCVFISCGLCAKRSCEMFVLILLRVLLLSQQTDTPHTEVTATGQSMLTHAEMPTSCVHTRWTKKCAC